MKKKILWALFIVFCFFSIAAGSETEKVIISAHPGYPPISWQQQDTLVGVAVEMAEQIFTELGIPYEIRVTGPWARVQIAAKHGDIDVIAAAYKNPERETFMDYTLPFMKDPVVVFVWKGKSFPFNRWEDLIGKQGGTNIGESYEKEFDRFMDQKLTMTKVPKTIQNFKKLEKGRIDYFVFGLYPGLADASTTGYEDKIEVLPQPVVNADFYMAFSKKSAFRHLIPEIDNIIERYKKEGKIEKWIAFYLAYYKKSKK